jgi:hypothetical protein
LPFLPVGGIDMSAVEVKNSVYALGGREFEKHFDTVQKLSLDSLTWKLMQLKLPHAEVDIPCFKTETQVYLNIRSTLYSFTPHQVRRVKKLPQNFNCVSKSFSSYYSRGTLYCTCGFGISSLAFRI